MCFKSFYLKCQSRKNNRKLHILCAFYTLQLFLTLERLENHSRLDRSEAREGRIWRRKVKRRLVSSPLQRENVTSDSEQHLTTTEASTTTSTTSIPRQIESTSLSPEDWLEQFYNGKNLLRSKQIRKKMNKDKGKFDNFPRVQDNIVTQETKNDKINLFLKPLLVFSKDDIFEDVTTADLKITTVSPAPLFPSKSSVLTSGHPNSRRKIKFGTRLQPDLIANATNSVKLNKDIQNRLNIMVDKLKGMVKLKIN